MAVEQKIEQKEVQPRGVFWVGNKVSDVEVTSEAFYKQHGRVGDIVRLYLENKGNINKTVNELNEDLEIDLKPFAISADEILKLVDWASRNPITTKTIIRL
ncbi:MAG TPA: hypothetical protein VIK81_00160 [Patescibacteria group bacterium]